LGGPRRPGGVSKKRGRRKEERKSHTRGADLQSIFFRFASLLARAGEGSRVEPSEKKSRARGRQSEKVKIREDRNLTLCVPASKRGDPQGKEVKQRNHIVGFIHGVRAQREKQDFKKRKRPTLAMLQLLEERHTFET